MFARTRKRKNKIVTVTDERGIKDRPRKGILEQLSLAVPAMKEAVVVDMG